MAPYTAAESGVLRLTESLAEELRPVGVRVNSVSPTIIDTPRNRADMPDADFSSWVRPEALARTMLSIATEDMAVDSGADILVGAAAIGWAEHQGLYRMYKPWCFPMRALFAA